MNLAKARLTTTVVGLHNEATILTCHLHCQLPPQSHGTFLVDLHYDFIMVRNGHNCNFGLLQWKMGNLKEDAHI
ncbi:hypothetical protein L3X38_025683 [Prunus dulcis]|uniref:Uncharacterized protein n=1 Tax=Prunus dulcis TaxID=3755 RepID=A0AAD4W246_PRUDU|nr:hypothetical protein L3X38_025683 [Prunus dulcis]